MISLRIMGPEDEVMALVAELRARAERLGMTLDASRPYPNRNDPKTVRVYVDGLEGYSITTSARAPRSQLGATGKGLPGRARPEPTFRRNTR